MSYNEFENEDFFEDEQDEIVQLKKQSQMLEQADAEKARQVEENYQLISRNGVDWSVLPKNESDRLISTINIMIEWYIENGEQYEKCSKLNTIIKQLQN
jgi:aminoglycoside/choline kinase family phosphotransferase